MHFPSKRAWDFITISTYICLSANWLSSRFGTGGVVFEDSAANIASNLVLILLPAIWILGKVSKSKKFSRSFLLGISLIFTAFTAMIAYLNDRVHPFSLISDRSINAKTRIKVYEDCGTAIDMPTRFKITETKLIPGIKWIKESKSCCGKDNDLSQINEP